MIYTDSWPRSAEGWVEHVEDHSQTAAQFGWNSGVKLLLLEKIWLVQCFSPVTPTSAHNNFLLEFFTGTFDVSRVLFRRFWQGGFSFLKPWIVKSFNFWNSSRELFRKIPRALYRSEGYYFKNCHGQNKKYHKAKNSSGLYRKPCTELFAKTQGGAVFIFASLKMNQEKTVSV